MPSELISNNTIFIGIGVVLVCAVAYGIYSYYYYKVDVVTTPTDDLSISSNETLVNSDGFVDTLEELLFIKDVPTSADRFFTKQGLIAVDKARILEQYRLESAHQ